MWLFFKKKRGVTLVLGSSEGSDLDTDTLWVVVYFFGRKFPSFNIQKKNLKYVPVAHPIAASSAAFRAASSAAFRNQGTIQQQ